MGLFFGVLGYAHKVFVFGADDVCGICRRRERVEVPCWCSGQEAVMFWRSTSRRDNRDGKLMIAILGKLVNCIENQLGSVYDYILC